jgi:hypothetical protein
LLDLVEREPWKSVTRWLFHRYSVAQFSLRVKRV